MALFTHPEKVTVSSKLLHSFVTQGHHGNDMSTFPVCWEKVAACKITPPYCESGTSEYRVFPRFPPNSVNLDMGSSNKKESFPGPQHTSQADGPGTFGSD